MMGEKLTKRIVVYGAGNRAFYALNYCRNKYKPEELVLSDTNPEKWGRELFDVMVISPKELPV